MGFLTKDGEDPYLKVEVSLPQNEFTDQDGWFTTYQVTLQTNYLAFTLSQSHVRRRYSEFVWLRKHLQLHHSHIKIPKLPKKTWFKSKLSPDVIQNRTDTLQQFLDQLLGETEFLADTSVHLFLQTPLNVAEMMRCLDGHTGKQVCDIVKMCDQLYKVSQLRDAALSDVSPIPCSISKSNPPHTDPLEMPSPSQVHLQPSTQREVFSPSRPHSGPTVQFTIGTSSSERDAPVKGYRPGRVSRFTSIEEDGEKKVQESGARACSSQEQGLVQEAFVSEAKVEGKDKARISL